MLFSVSYKNNQNEQGMFILSANTWDEVLVYCSTQSYSPENIMISTWNLIVSGPLTQAYSFSLKDNTTGTLESYLMYDTYDNVILWISNQSNKTVQNMTIQQKPLVVA